MAYEDVLVEKPRALKIPAGTEVERAEIGSGGRPENGPVR